MRNKSKKAKDCKSNKQHIKDIKEELKSNPKLLNEQLPNILKTFIINIDEANSEDRCEDLLTEKNNIYEIIEHYLLESKEDTLDAIVNFLVEKLNTLTKVYFQVLDLTSDNILNNLMLEFLYSNLRILGDSRIVEELIEKILFEPKPIDKGTLKHLVITFFEYDPELELSLNQLSLRNLKLLYSHCKAKSEKINFVNFLNLFFSFEQMEVSQSSEDEAVEYKTTFQNILTFFISSHYSDLIGNSDIAIKFIKHLNSTLFSLCEDPTVYSEFLLDLYKDEDIEQKNDIKVVTLSSLFVLITKYSYVFEYYYERLYEGLFCKDILKTKYLNRYLKLVYLSLRPSSVNILIVCSFIKKLIRLALSEDSHVICKILILIEHLLHYHNGALRMIYRKPREARAKDKLSHTSVQDGIYYEDCEFVIPKEYIGLGEEKTKIILKNSFPFGFRDIEVCNNSKKADLQIQHERNFDDFDDLQTDPLITKSFDSCLWELYSLERHYNFKVRQTVKRLSKKLTKKTLDIDSLMEISKEDFVYDLSERNVRNITFSNFILTTMQGEDVYALV